MPQIYKMLGVTRDSLEENIQKTGIVFNGVEFQLNKILWSGAFGKIFSAMSSDTRDNQEYIVKTGKQDKVATPHELQMLRQAGIYFSVQYEKEDKAFLLMKRISGLSLDRIIFSDKVNELSEEEKLTIAYQACYALHELHAKQIVHGDMHPSNIIFDDKNKTASIVDLGRAQNVRDQVAKSAVETESNTRRRINYCFELDINGLAGGVLNLLAMNDHLKNAVIKPMQDQQVIKRPSLGMVMASLAEEALKMNFNIWNESQPKPTLNMCNLLYRASKAVNQYRHHYMAQFIKIHGSKSVAAGEKLIHELFAAKTEEQLYTIIHEFLKSYEGNIREYSLKVLLAESLLNRPAGKSEQERKSVVAELEQIAGARRDNSEPIFSEKSNSWGVM